MHLELVRCDTFEKGWDLTYYKPTGPIHKCLAANKLPPKTIGNGKKKFKLCTNEREWHDFNDDREGHRDAWAFLIKMARERGETVTMSDIRESGRSKGLFEPAWKNKMRAICNKFRRSDRASVFRQIVRSDGNPSTY